MTDQMTEPSITSMCNRYVCSHVQNKVVLQSIADTHREGPKSRLRLGDGRWKLIY